MSAIVQSSTVSALCRAFTKFGSREPSGQLCCNSTDEIACWCIGTNCDGESFHEKIRRALRAGIGEAAWATLYSTVSRPFAPPTTGKIADKVINHYGDEVLKVYEVAR